MHVRSGDQGRDGEEVSGDDDRFQSPAPCSPAAGTGSFSGEERADLASPRTLIRCLIGKDEPVSLSSAVNGYGVSNPPTNLGHGVIDFRNRRRTRDRKLHWAPTLTQLARKSFVANNLLRENCPIPARVPAYRAVCPAASLDRLKPLRKGAAPRSLLLTARKDDTSGNREQRSVRGERTAVIDELSSSANAQAIHPHRESRHAMCCQSKVKCPQARNKVECPLFFSDSFSISGIEVLFRDVCAIEISSRPGMGRFDRPM
jgi:hypothetical protein